MLKNQVYSQSVRELLNFRDYTVGCVFHFESPVSYNLVSNITVHSHTKRHGCASSQSHTVIKMRYDYHEFIEVHATNLKRACSFFGANDAFTEGFKHKRKVEAYCYGFNSMEKDDEMKGNGNSYTTEFRQYDPRIGRWLSLDPKMAKYPYQSPFAAFNNNPIFWIDPFGDDPPPGYSLNSFQAPRLNPFEYRNQLNHQVIVEEDRKCYLNNKFDQNRSKFTRINNSNIYALQTAKGKEYHALYFVPEIRVLSDGSEEEDEQIGFYVVRRCQLERKPLQIEGGFTQARDLFSSSVVPVSQMTDPKYRGKEQMTFTLNTMGQEIQNEINQTLNSDPNIDKSSLQVVSLLVHINADLPQDYKEVLMSKIKSHFEVGQNIQVNFRQLSSRNMGANGDTQVCRTFTNIEYDRYEVDCE